MKDQGSLLLDRRQLVFMAIASGVGYVLSPGGLGTAQVQARPSWTSGLQPLTYA